VERIWRHQTISHVWVLWWPQILTGLLALPLAVMFAAWMAARRRQAGWAPGWATRASVAETAMVVGTLPWLWMTLTPVPGQRPGHNFIPFADLAHQFHVGTTYAIVQITGNLLVFAALGAAIPVRWRVGPLAALAAGAAGSLLIEASQFVLPLGRYASVDDIMVNAAGAWLAAWLTRGWWRSRVDAVVATKGLAGTYR
jgi:hypothetical protein